MVAREGEFSNYASADQMFLNDAFEHFRRAGVIPCPFGINDCDGSICADAKTIGFGAIDQRFGADKAQFLEPLLEKLPRRIALFLRATFRFRLVCAQKNVALIMFQPQFVHTFVQFAVHQASVFREGLALKRRRVSICSIICNGNKKPRAINCPGFMENRSLNLASVPV